MTKKTRQYAFIGLMMPGILLGVMFSGLVAASCISELFKNPDNWSLIGTMLLNVAAAVLCVIIPLRIYGLAEHGRPRSSRRLLTGVAVVLAYLLPSIYLGLMSWYLQQTLVSLS